MEKSLCSKLNQHLHKKKLKKLNNLNAKIRNFNRNYKRKLKNMKKMSLIINSNYNNKNNIKNMHYVCKNINKDKNIYNKLNKEIKKDKKY